MWVAMTIVGFIACGVINDPRLPKGNPKKLVNPIDYQGNVCGVDSSVENNQYAYYFADGQGNLWSMDSIFLYLFQPFASRAVQLVIIINSLFVTMIFNRP